MLGEVTRRNSSKAQTETRLMVALSASVVAFATGGAFLSALYYPHIFVLAGLLTASRRIAYERIHAIESAAPSAEAVRVASRGGIAADWVARRGISGLPLPGTAVRNR
jgi:short subunit fatty acids transporter